MLNVSILSRLSAVMKGEKGPRLGRKLAEGGMAEVFKIYDGMRTPPWLVVKVAKIDNFLRYENAVCGALTINEAAALADIGAHQNIVGLVDSGEIEGRPYCALEYIKALDLKGLVERKEFHQVVAQNIALFLSMARGIATALAYIHQKGRVHGDIKPENILFDPMAGAVKVIDFNLSFRIGTEGHRQYGNLRSEGYESFDLLKGLLSSPGDDLVALGAVFYFVLTGKMLQRAAKISPTKDGFCLFLDLGDIFANYGKTIVRAEFPPGIEGLLARMAQHDHAERILNGQDLLTCLGSLSAGENARL